MCHHRPANVFVFVKICFYFVCMSVHLCVCTYVPHTFLVLREARHGPWVPWNWSYRLFELPCGCWNWTRILLQQMADPLSQVSQRYHRSFTESKSRLKVVQQFTQGLLANPVVPATLHTCPLPPLTCLTGNLVRGKVIWLTSGHQLYASYLFISCDWLKGLDLSQLHKEIKRVVEVDWPRSFPSDCEFGSLCTPFLWLFCAESFCTLHELRSQHFSLEKSSYFMAVAHVVCNHSFRSGMFMVVTIDCLLM